MLNILLQTFLQKKKIWRRSKKHKKQNTKQVNYYIVWMILSYEDVFFFFWETKKIKNLEVIFRRGEIDLYEDVIIDSLN